MFDSDTAELINSAPALSGLERNLSEELADLFAELASIRVALRGQSLESGDLRLNSITKLRNQALMIGQTYEANTLVSDDRDEQRACAFASATAYQIAFNAEVLANNGVLPSKVTAQEVSPAISAALLFMISGAYSDAKTISSALDVDSDDISKDVVRALRYLVRSEVGALTRMSAEHPTPLGSLRSELAFCRLLSLLNVGLLELAMCILDPTVSKSKCTETFSQVLSLSSYSKYSVSAPDVGLTFGTTISSFPGLSHLSRLLLLVAKDLPDAAVARLPTPTGISPESWVEAVRTLSVRRPLLWPNHREAIETGVLNRGTSGALGFPTGAGKSTLSELKIQTCILAEKKVVFLAPTHALANQTTQSLKTSFPKANVGTSSSFQDASSSKLDENEILVATPESCLYQIGLQPELFEDVGLVVFDECHLLGFKATGSNRRAMDSMLAVLALSKCSPSADFLLISAMMKNTSDVANWLEALTRRPALSLTSRWKPTRQLRGTIVYNENDVAKIKGQVRAVRKQANLKRKDQELAGKTFKKRPAPNAKAHSLTGAIPFAMLSLRQQWLDWNSLQYSFQPLDQEKVKLGLNPIWQLTSNSGVVASQIAVNACKAGLRTLVFFRNPGDAATNAGRISDGIVDSKGVELSEQQASLLDRAADEFGGVEHLYISHKNAHASAVASCHHGRLTSEEREVTEGLFRSGKLKALCATSTLAQGMNLPADLVILADVSQFEKETGYRSLLDAQDLLNAAGRAGRAGEVASGTVLVVPEKVVTVSASGAISDEWKGVKSIFDQPDQCLEIDDPLSAILDRLQTQPSLITDAECFVLDRLIDCDDGSGEKKELKILSKTLAAIRHNKSEQTQWVEQRTRALESYFSGRDVVLSVEKRVGAALNLSPDRVETLLLALGTEGSPKSIIDIVDRIFAWLVSDRKLVCDVFRPQAFGGLFKESTLNEIREGKCSNETLDTLQKCTKLWIDGQPLKVIEQAFGTKNHLLKTCDKARRFVQNFIVDLSFLAGLPRALDEARTIEGEEETVPLTAVMDLAASCIRSGYDLATKALLSSVAEPSNRRAVHRIYDQLALEKLSTLEATETTDFLRSHLEITLAFKRMA